MVKCLLPGCNKKARRKFCSNKHKDKYHNINNPRGYGLGGIQVDPYDLGDEDMGSEDYFGGVYDRDYY